MKKIQVFLSSAMNGELGTERAVLRARFGPGTLLGNTFELYLFEDNASPVSATTAYVQEVENSPIAVFLFAETLRPAVVEEFNAATRGSAIFCYLRAGSRRTSELDEFIRDRIEHEVQYAEFSNTENLSKRVEGDLQRWIAQLVYGRSLQMAPSDIAHVAALDSSTAQRFCDLALADREAAHESQGVYVPVDLCAHSLWGTVRPKNLGGLSFDRQARIQRFDQEIDDLEINGAIFRSLKAFASRGLRFATRVLLLHPDSEQAAMVNHSQRTSSDATERERFALSDIYLTLYVLGRLATRHTELGLSTIRVMSPEDSMAFSLTRIGAHALIAPYPKDLLLEGAASYSVKGSPGETTPFGKRLAEFEETWRGIEAPGGGYQIDLATLPSGFEDLRRRVDELIERNPGWHQSDPTPFGTRTKLLTRYIREVQAFWNGEDPYPVALEVNPANYCDQDCHWCISENAHHPGSSINFHHGGFASFVGDFCRLGGKACVWSGGGEPTNHPDLAHGMSIVSEAGISQGMITHGAFSESLIDPIVQYCQWIRISVDTNDSEAYARKRGRSRILGLQAFDRVVKNATSLVAAGANVGLNVNVARWNLAQVEDIYEWAATLGVSYLQIRPTLLTPFPHVQDEDLLSPNDVPGLLRRLGSLGRKARKSKTKLVISHDKFVDVVKPDYGRSYTGCAAHRLFVVLNANADLAVCMYQMNDRRFILGNIYKDSLETIWQSDQRKEVLRFCSKLLNHAIHECQVCCKGHEINKVLDGGHRVEPPHLTASSPFI